MLLAISFHNKYVVCGSITANKDPEKCEAFSRQNASFNQNGAHSYPTAGLKRLVLGVELLGGQINSEVMNMCVDTGVAKWFC